MHFRCIFGISLLSPLRKGCGPLFEQTYIPVIQGCFVLSLVKMALWFWRRRFFKIKSLYYRHFVIISPWKRAWPFIWTNLNPRQVYVRSLMLIWYFGPFGLMFFFNCNCWALTISLVFTFFSGVISYFRIGCVPQKIVDGLFEDVKKEMQTTTP